MQKGRVANWNICIAPRTTTHGVVTALKVHCIGTNQAMYFGPNMAECARMLREEKDASPITYAGELPTNWETYLKAIVAHLYISP